MPKPKRLSHRLTGLTTDCQQALSHLLAAHRSAAELSLPRLEFAWQLPSLHALRVTDVTLRCLVRCGLVEHYLETTRADQAQRAFRRAPNLRFTKASCLVISAAGIALAEPSIERDPRAPVGGNRPHWDAVQRQLRCGPHLVKHFKVPAPNQELILDAFEEEAWPAHIDDPLSPHPALDPKRRLHNAIDSLNRNQKHSLLRFHGDGRGRGICWELRVSSPTDHRHIAGS
jgi:hypothetical protein